MSLPPCLSWPAYQLPLSWSTHTLLEAQPNLMKSCRKLDDSSGPVAGRFMGATFSFVMAGLKRMMSMVLSSEVVGSTNTLHMPTVIGDLRKKTYTRTGS
jgi:hypothetical protein